MTGPRAQLVGGRARVCLSLMSTPYSFCRIHEKNVSLALQDIDASIWEETQEVDRTLHPTPFLMHQSQ